MKNKPDAHMQTKPTSSLNKQKFDNLATEIWKSAERLRGKFKAYEYQNVILQIIVIRRLECVLIKWREDKKAELRQKQPKRTEKEVNLLVKQLEQNPKVGPSFSNQRQVETLLAYRKSLIPECVTGKRRITDEDLKRVGANV